jgi:hypothetical protein
MGLDQYLYARKRYDRGTEEADAVLAVARAGDPKPFPRDGAVVHYLGTWEYGSDPATFPIEWGAGRKRMRPEVAELLALTGTEAVFNADNGVGVHVRVTDDAVILDVECAYWRKANAVHDWFVRECQDGVDECQTSDAIDVEQLAHLRDLAQHAIEAYDSGDPAKAAELLTPTSGFFFGSTEVDDWYRQDLVSTVEQLERAVRSAMAVGGVTFHYHSSW